MGNFEPASASLTEKTIFFNTLLNELLENTHHKLSNAVRALYLIFGFQNKIIHKDGKIYEITSQQELEAIFKEVPAPELQQASNAFVQPETGVEILADVFEKLKASGFDLRYAYPADKDANQKVSNLERMNSLIENIREFLSTEVQKGELLDEYMIFNGSNVSKMQEELQKRILDTKISDLAPDTLLIAYYKVFAKLPLS